MKIGLFVVRFRGDVMIRLFRSSGEERERERRRRRRRRGNGHHFDGPTWPGLASGILAAISSLLSTTMVTMMVTITKVIPMTIFVIIVISCSTTEKKSEREKTFKGSDNP